MLIQPSAHSGLSIIVAGLPRQIDEVVNTLVSYTLEKLITPATFFLAKEQLITLWERYIGEGDAIAAELLKCSIFQQETFSLDFLGPLAQIDLHSLNMYILGFKNSCFSYVELMGNISVQTFTQIALHLEKMPFAPTLNNNPNLYTASFVAMDPDICRPGESCIRVKNLSSCKFTTTVTNLYVLGPYGTDQTNADLFALAMSFMNFEAFMDLRTRQQLGYNVHTQKLCLTNMKVPLMMFYVSITATASKYSACELDAKIDQFLADYGNKLEEIKPELYKTMLMMV